MRMHAFQRLLTGFAARWSFRCHGFLVALAMGLACFVPASANAQDSIHERPPLAWEEIERWIRRWSDVDEGPAWQQAWASIELAYLVFLEEEDRRRRVEGRALADLYEPILVGVARVEEVDRLYLARTLHAERAAVAEDAFLRSLDAFMPPSANGVVDVLQREREIARTMARCAWMAPEMLRLTGTILDAEFGGTTDAPAEADARRGLREAVDRAHTAMMPHARELDRAVAERARLFARGLAEEAWLRSGGTGAEGMAVEEAVLASRERTRREALDPTATVAKAYAAIERIGVDAVLAAVDALEAPLRTQVQDALGTPRHSFARVATLQFAEKRLAALERRAAPSELERAAISAATARLRDESLALAIDALRALRDDAPLIEERLARDLESPFFHGQSHGPWFGVSDARRTKASEAIDEAMKQWIRVVRTELRVPQESRWPWSERDAHGVPIIEPPSGAELEERELAEMRNGFGWSIEQDERPVFTHPLADWASIDAVASRLAASPETRVQLKALHAAREREWAEVIAPAHDAIVEGLADTRIDDEEMLRQAGTLIVRAAAIRRQLADDVRATLGDTIARAPDDERRIAAEGELRAWELRHRLPEGQTAVHMYRSIAGIPIGERSWIDLAGNPFEALDQVELSFEERSRVLGAIVGVADSFVLSAVAMEKAAAHVALERALRQANRLSIDDTPVHHLRSVWETAGARRSAIREAHAPLAERRAADAELLVEAILAALPDGKRAAFARASEDAALPGINRERPRFERPLLAALRVVAADADRAARIVEIYTSWDRAWTRSTAAIATVGGGAGYARSITPWEGRLQGAEALHAIHAVTWIEFRRRQESLVAMRAMERLLSAEERAALPRW